ncbi:hypothetical protein DQW77_10855 [Roseovarius sp. TE539]|uniref:hypothetical protein n=1 Tax=Roseovarius sp. TE539 TaxID=2249812 RepID=UPI000DDE098D|nr:hypothetical protein [Roseovarius sp. TE539]RBI72258.1 hypothetical protein DQW77_10855 [Roseovarius sp. TE539]
MGVTEDLADELAQEAIKYIDATGDEQIISDLVKELGATSQTAEEAFLTSVRVRRANARARQLLAEKVRAYKARKDQSGGG